MRTKSVQIEELEKKKKIKELSSFQKRYLNGLLNLPKSHQDYDDGSQDFEFNETKQTESTSDPLMDKFTEDKIKNYWESKMLDAWYWCILINVQNTVF